MRRETQQGWGWAGIPGQGRVLQVFALSEMPGKVTASRGTRDLGASAGQGVERAMRAGSGDPDRSAGRVTRLLQQESFAQTYPQLVKCCFSV